MNVKWGNNGWTHNPAELYDKFWIRIPLRAVQNGSGIIRKTYCSFFVLLQMDLGYLMTIDDVVRGLGDELQGVRPLVLIWPKVECEDWDTCMEYAVFDNPPD